MSRTVSSPRPEVVAEPRSRSSSHDLILAMIWSCIAELWKIGPRYQALHEALPRLDRQLAHPTAPQREGYWDACERYDRWWVERQALEMKVPTLKSNMAKHFGKLSQRQRQALIANPGWPQTTDPKQVAEGIWQRARSKAVWPGGEPPFDLTELSDWLDARMAEQRMEIADGVADRYRHGRA